MNCEPKIGITRGGVKDFPNMPELYCKAVDKAAGLASFISPEMDISALTLHYDGFIIPGGKDIDPLLYNESRRFKIKPEKSKRMEFEIALLKQGIKKRKPFLGICYGMQLINVALGGTLYQDICFQLPESSRHIDVTHIIKINDNPYLEKGEYEVNSSHHQAIKGLGKGVKPFIYSTDGIIEAFYVEGRNFLFGVQWHPERVDNLISKRIFKIFTEACCDNK